MPILYNFIISVAGLLLKLGTLVSPKLALFVNGRKSVFKTLQNHISKTDKVIWLHAASLGEYEQGVPILEKLRQEYPSYKLLLTFFSPSGYEIKKNTATADIITYLPLDTKKNALKFLDVVRPQLVIFIKYEIWPNYLTELKKRTIPTVLISARFKKNQIFFRRYGSFMRKALASFSHFHVQNKNSRQLLNTIGFTNVTVTGDTRLDRVSEILQKDNSLDFMEKFKQKHFCFVAGSTWSEDEQIITDYINKTTNNLKFVIAPHTIKEEHIRELKKKIQQPALLYSEYTGQELNNIRVLIIDTIGILTKIYSYADLAYVGGGFSTGLHNTLEPAVFGIPVLIGPKYKGFMEAEDLVALGGVLSITNKEGFSTTLNRLFVDEELRSQTGEINVNYILNNKGASIQIMDYIRTLL